MASSSKDLSVSDGGGAGNGNLFVTANVQETNGSHFSEGEKVLAFHGPRIYEAKIQKVELRKDEWRYYVHYLGWNKSWDEWVDVDRLMKFTEENILKQQALDKDLGVDKNSKSVRSTQIKPKGSSGAKLEKDDNKANAAKGKKRKIDSAVENCNFSGDKGVKIQIPSTLRKQLVNDWESVTHQDKLVKLPRTPNVDEIFRHYLDYRSKKDGMTSDSTIEILKGMRCYFDQALSRMLLYNEERQQYREAVTDNVSPSTVYGAEHLLRLFVKLPGLLKYVLIEEGTIASLQQTLQDIVKFLQKNQTTFFLSAYDGTEPSEDKGKAKTDSAAS